MIVELFLGNLQRLAQVFQEMMMVILFGPVCRVETVVISDSRLDASIYQELTDFSFTVLCGHVKCAEA